MLWVPSKGRVKYITNQGIVGTATPGSTVISNATPPTDGAIVEMITAANNIQDSYGITITINNTSASVSVSEGCMDILIGGATDDVLCAALICGTIRGLGDNSGYVSYYFPVHIPQGKRIAATFASGIVSKSATVIVTLHGGMVPPHRVGRKITTIGTQIDNARGQNVIPAVSGGAAAVTQMIASSAADYFYFLPGHQMEADSVNIARTLNIGIGIGAATEDRIGTWTWDLNSGEGSGWISGLYGCWHDVPASTRISMLSSSSGTNTDTNYGGLVYAVS